MMSSSLLCIASGGSLVDLDGTVFIQMGIFFLMFIFLYFALFRPVLRMIEARREATEGTTDKAHEMKENAIKMSAEIDSQMIEIRAAASQERGRVVENARQKEREILAQATESSKAQIEKARQQMHQGATDVRGQLTKEIGQLADAVASRIIARKIDGES